jgi:hypothetical protein
MDQFPADKTGTRQATRKAGSPFKLIPGRPPSGRTTLADVFASQP